MQKYKYIFGPVYSRRFGISLGIDVSPDKKSCNFDCLYCELSQAKPIDKIFKEPLPEEIIKEVQNFLYSTKKIDVITITANGEPTLYTKLDELVNLINKIKGNIKTLILTNSSTIYKEDVQETLSKIDIVKLSLDAVDENIFKKIDKPLNNISIKKIIEGIKTFRKKYKGNLIIEILLVKFVNDTKKNIENLIKVLKDIKPDRIDLGTIDRPPAYRVFPVSNEELCEFSKMFKEEGLPVNVIERKNIYTPEFDLTQEEIINTLKKRPLTEEDIQNIFSPKTQSLINMLKIKGIIKEKNINGKVFLTI